MIQSDLIPGAVGLQSTFDMFDVTKGPMSCSTHAPSHKVDGIT